MDKQIEEYYLFSLEWKNIHLQLELQVEARGNAES